MASFVRMRQPGITRVLPHVQNRKYAVSHGTQFFADVDLAGDSIMRGVPTSNASAYIGDAEFSSPPTDGSGVTAFIQWTQNAASGSTLQAWWDNRVAWMGGFAGDSVIMHAGSNDIFSVAGITDNQLQTLVSDLTDYIRDTLGKQLGWGSILPSNISGPNWSAAKETQRKNHNIWLQGFCLDNNMAYFDVATPVTDPADDRQINPLYWNAGTDPFHLNTDGSAAAAGAVYQGLSECRKRTAYQP